MPVHQISVVPARDTANNGRSSGRSKEKSREAESEKPPRRSGSRSSNISKASSSTTGLGHTSFSRTSVTPSSQDICSPSRALPKVEEDVVELTPVTVLSRSGQPGLGKRQVKRKHRKKQDVPQGPGENSGGSDPREEGNGGRRDCRRDRAPPTSSSDEGEEESWREGRSWIRQRPRRGRRREEAGENDPAMELVSLDSADGLQTNEQSRTSATSARQMEASRQGLKNRRKPSVNQDERSTSSTSSLKKGKPGSFEEEILISGRSHGSSSPQEEPRVAVAFEDRGSGEDVLSVPCPPSPAADPTSACLAGQSSPAQQQHQCSDDELEVCRICHCEGDEECALITPCRCTGSLRFVHQGCLHQWIKSSDTRCCELCKYDFIMQTQLKPLRKWEKLQMSASERRKIICSVTFHIIAVTCVVWSLYVLIDRTAEEIKQGKENGVLEWPFWTKLIVVAIGFTGGLIFMYIQCKVYLQLWRRLKAFNRIIFVQNCPDTVVKGEEKCSAPLAQTNGRHDSSVEVPAPPVDKNSHRPPGGAPVPDMAPV